ncbi:MAG: ribonuclease HII [Thermoproteota archaeon]|nr:ribonuclease HII [Candidatus Brockarchaeota archaeon]MBO3768344.1 ribonuclease HII [Candidatus Brockarchaeota archaeon]MBO3800721.1 ribonuclease HII [Candidatus Brockarchaeota archaeon]
MIVSGSDEAGRGSVIGPLVIATVTINQEDEEKFKEIGVKDSKKLSPRKREVISKVIKENCISYKVSYLKPKVIDSYVWKRIKMKTLNYLEAKVISRHIIKLSPDIAYVDSPYSKPETFKVMIKKLIGNKNTKIFSANKAEDKWVEVACASIIAKVERDKAVRKIAKKYGFFGSGYPSDKRTRNFLRKVISKSDKCDFVRWSWKTIDKLSLRQLKLTEK